MRQIRFGKDHVKSESKYTRSGKIELNSFEISKYMQLTLIIERKKIANKSTVYLAILLNDIWYN
jgi:hypothetical protein